MMKSEREGCDLPLAVLLLQRFEGCSRCCKELTGQSNNEESQ